MNESETAAISTLACPVIRTKHSEKLLHMRRLVEWGLMCCVCEGGVTYQRGLSNLQSSSTLLSRVGFPGMPKQLGRDKSDVLRCQRLNHRT